VRLDGRDMNAHVKSMAANAQPLGLGQVRAATSIRWAALGEAGVVVAMLAGIEAEMPNKTMRNFPALLRDCQPWQCELATGWIEDLAAIMESGLAALLAVNARGTDCRAAALALWNEFTAARAALLSLLPPAGALGPVRTA
jgi:hypothetical protein